MITITTNPALHHALTTADTVPCTGDPLWTSDHTEDLETAAQLCIARLTGEIQDAGGELPSENEEAGK